MVVPLLLIALATGAATIIAYGTHPGLAHYAQGLKVILFTRRAEWPLILLSLTPCLILLWMVIGGRRRVWWLVGLIPVLALFTVRFAPWRQSRYFVIASPVFVDAGQPGMPRDDEWVVGVVFNDQPYALPYRQLFRAPVVFITDYDKRMMVLWSAFANRAYATHITRELKPRDLEIFTQVAGTVLVYDRRLGEFICPLTGQTLDRGKPIGFGAPIPTDRTTWAQWHAKHRDSKALVTVFANSDYPTSPILPENAGKLVDGTPAETPVALIGSNPPVATAPLKASETIENRSAGSVYLLLLTDPKTGKIRAFDRRVGEDLFPIFTRYLPRRRNEDGFMTDRDSASIWTAEGKCVAGPLKDSQLKEYSLEDGLYWGPLKYWYPDLVLAK